MQTSLPFDILTEIIGILAEDRQMRQIKRISCLSSLCRDHCRQYIFHTIEVGSSVYGVANPTPSTSRFVSLIKNHPIVIPYIRQFKLVNESDDPALPPALRHLTNLSKLQIKRVTMYPAQWTECLTKVLQSLSHIRSLQYLHLQNVSQFPASVISYLPYIQHLKLMDVRFLSEATVEDIVTSPPLKIASLELYRVDIMRLLSERNGRSLIDASGLSSIRFSGATSRETEGITRLCQSPEVYCKLQSLQDLTFSVGYFRQPDIPKLQHDIERWISPYRRTLTNLDVTLTIRWGVVQDVYSGLCRALNAMGSDNVLASLKVHVRLRPSPEQGTRTQISRRCWTPLVDVLTMPGWKHLIFVWILVKLSQPFRFKFESKFE